MHIYTHSLCIYQSFSNPKSKYISTHMYYITSGGVIFITSQELTCVASANQNHKCSLVTTDFFLSVVF